MLQPNDPEAKAAAIPTPKSVQTTASLLFLYAVLLLVNDLIFAVRTHHWVLIWVGVSQAGIGLWLMGGLYQLKKWAWWVLVIGGAVVGLRDIVGLLADIARLLEHRPVPQPQFVGAYLLGVLFLLPVVARLLMRPSRVAFGPAKPSQAAVEHSQPGVWPPPPSAGGPA